MSTVDTQSYSAETVADDAPTATLRFRSLLARYHWAAALILYSGVTIALAYPALRNLNDTVVGGSWGDNTWYVWYLWLFRREVLAGQDPGHTHYVFALLPSVQVFIEAFFADVVAFPLQWLTTPVGAYDLVVVLSFMLSGLTMYLLAREFVENRLACFVAGFVYDFSTFHFARSQGHLGLLTMQWLPFCAWRLFALYRRPSKGNAILAGLGLALVPFSEIYFLGYFAIPFVLVFVIFVLVSDRGWITQRRNLLLCSLAAVVALALAGPYLATFAVVDPDLRASMVPAGLEQYSADLLAFFIPSNASPIYGHLTLPIYQGMQLGGAEETGFLGYPALLLAAVAFLLRRNIDRFAWFWLVLALVGLVLALGPVLHVEGQAILPLPAYRLLYGWSSLSSFRSPSRLSVVPLTAVSVLAAYGVAGLARRFTGNRLAHVAGGCLIVALLLETLAENACLTVTLTTATVPVPALYQEMAHDTSSGLALDIPFGPFASEKYQEFQTAHHRLLVAGSLPRTSDRMLNSLLDRPALAQFYQPGLPAVGTLQGSADIFPVTRDLSTEVRRDHIRYVVLHRLDIPSADGWVLPYLQENLGRPFYRNASQGLVAWRVTGRQRPAASAPRYQFRLGSGWLPGLGMNNGVPVRTVEQDGEITIDALRAGRRALAFDAYADFRPLAMEIRFDAKLVKRVRFARPGSIQTVKLPTLSLRAGPNVLQIHSVEGCRRPIDFIPGDQDPRCFAFGVEQVRWRSR